MRGIALVACCVLASALASASGCGGSSGSTAVGQQGSSGGAGGAGRAQGVVPQSCTLGDKVDDTTTESPLMDPGMTCLRCHASNFGPSQLVAGTVFWSLHEPDLCPGADGTVGEAAGLQVILVDAAGTTFFAPVRKDGNFYLSMTSVAFVPPYRASVRRADGTSVSMATAQTDGDCNACHTAEGAGEGSLAPGRIVVP